MFQNALMYNKKGHDVHEITLEIQKEVGDAIEEFVLAEKQAQAQAAGPSGLPPSTGGKTSSSTDTPATKQRGRERRTPAAAVQAQEEAGTRRRSRTSTDTDPGSAASAPLTRTALKKKANG